MEEKTKIQLKLKDDNRLEKRVSSDRLFELEKWFRKRYNFSSNTDIEISLAFSDNDFIEETITLRVVVKTKLFVDENGKVN